MAFEDKMRTLLNLVKVPTGTIIHVVGTDVPTGYLLCNGAAVSRTKYSSLFAKIGTKFGTGDGSTTFNLPNLEGRVLQATTNTSEAGKFLEASLPNITGTIHAYALGTAGEANDHWTGMCRPQRLIQSKGIVTETVSSTIYLVQNQALDASKSSQLFSGSKLQVPALQLLACIRC